MDTAGLAGWSVHTLSVRVGRRPVGAEPGSGILFWPGVSRGHTPAVWCEGSST